MYCIRINCSLILSSLCIGSLFGQEISTSFAFSHFVIDQPLPGEGYGTGGFALADYDGDGDLDMTLSRRSDTTLYWYAYQDDGSWDRYVAAKHGGGQLGAVALDVDQDGAMDLVMGRAWIRNPGDLAKMPDKSWEVHLYHGGMHQENHDFSLADMNQDGMIDIVAYAQGEGILRWYDRQNPMSWTYHDIAVDVNELNVHGGFAPKGAGDLSGDGYPDVLMPFYCYENPGSRPGSWKRHAWPYVDVGENLYGRSFRSWILDLDMDGDQDFVTADCDVGMSRAYWYENEGQGSSFKRNALPLPDGPTGSFHSLAVADFDLDGDQDIFIGEQEDDSRLPQGSMKPLGLEERGIIFRNIGTVEGPIFQAQVIQTDNPGWHDTQVGDVDGDGDLDLVTKIWKADEGGVWHADFWRNELKR